MRRLLSGSRAITLKREWAIVAFRDLPFANHYDGTVLQTSIT